jgi:hypothetical protein
MHRHEFKAQDCVHTDSCSHAHAHADVQAVCAICSFIITVAMPVLGVVLMGYIFRRSKRCVLQQHKVAQADFLIYFLRGPPAMCLPYSM